MTREELERLRTISKSAAPTAPFAQGGLFGGQWLLLRILQTQRYQNIFGVTLGAADAESGKICRFVDPIIKVIYIETKDNIVFAVFGIHRH